MTLITPVPDNRPLTQAERRLLEWLLEHGTNVSVLYRSQLEDARVATCCSCGCASIDLAVNGGVPKLGEPIRILSEFEWADADGRLFGVFAFARCELLAGLEVWSQDGLAIADHLPTINELRPLGTRINNYPE